MYVISAYKHKDTGGEVRVDFFGPFQTKDRAEEYRASMEDWDTVRIDPLIVPNCIGVTFQTRY